MKRTGIEWIPEVGDQWRTYKVSHSFRTVGSGTTPDTENPAYYDGDVPWVTTTELRETIIRDTTKKVTRQALHEHSALKLFPPDSLLIAMYGATIGRLGVLGMHACMNQACCALSGGTFLDSRFVYYWLLGFRDHVIQLASGGGQPNISQEKIRSLRIPAPSREAQRGVANFLDRRTAAIDALIAKKERLIELLQEKRQALITQVVTKGLDPTVRMKPSGVRQFGDIPRSWELKRLMHLTPDDRQIMYGIVLPGPNVETGIPIVKSGDCQPHRLKLERLHRTTPEIEAPYARARLSSGDVVYAIRGSVGLAAIVPDELQGANLTQDAARIAPRPGVNSRWLWYLVQAHGVWSQLEAGVVGATVKGINIRDLKRPFVPVPPVEEQTAIADYLDCLVGKLGTVVSATERSVERLREYRQAIITAAVTGKIDVSKEAA